jgi:hydrogenase maturation protease
MILIAGIGNIFLGDDAFGSEVAQRLARLTLPDGVRVMDFGIRGLDLAYALLVDYQAVIIIDATPRGGTPGDVYILEPDLSGIGAQQTGRTIDAHDLDPVQVLAFARKMGARLQHVRIVGCEPESCGPPDEGSMGLSPRVAAAIDTAIEAVQSLIEEVLV